MTTYADDLAALLDTLEAGRAVVVGHSMGGYVAFELWRRHPDRVRALVLMNTRAAADDDEARERRNAMITKVRRDGTGAVQEDLVARLLADATRTTQPGVVERVRAMIRGCPAEGAAQALGAMRDRPDARSLLGTISVPALVLAGRDDAIVPAAESRAMAEAIPGAHLSVVPDAGHLAALEQPLHVSRIMGEFLEGLS
jgi:pimeloyl-ACP methyl ester carboxylesterase